MDLFAGLLGWISFRPFLPDRRGSLAANLSWVIYLLSFLGFRCTLIGVSVRRGTILRLGGISRLRVLRLRRLPSLLRRREIGGSGYRFAFGRFYLSAVAKTSAIITRRKRKHEREVCTVLSAVSP